MNDYQKYVKYKTKYLNEVSRRQSAGDGSVEDLSKLIWTGKDMTKRMARGQGDFYRDINDKKDENWTPYISMDGQKIVPTKILRQIVNTKNSRGQTFLYSAARKCNRQLIEVLLEAGANINDPCVVGTESGRNDGDTAIHGITFGECDIPKTLELIKYLKKNGATLNTANANGDTPYTLFLNKVETEWNNL